MKILIIFNSKANGLKNDVEHELSKIVLFSD